MNMNVGKPVREGTNRKSANVRWDTSWMYHHPVRFHEGTKGHLTVLREIRMVEVQDARFTNDEWQTLQFAVLRVYFRVTQVDGTIDHRERAALFDLLTEVAFDSPALSEVLRTMEDDFTPVFTAYLQDERDFVTAMQQTRILLLGKLVPEDAKQFVSDLIQLANRVANSSASEVFDAHNISPAEAEVVQSISSLLNPS
jgi:uncharacterized tellurite resistance protein B-like protein